MPNRLMTWKEQALLAVLAGALALGALTLYLTARVRTSTGPSQAFTTPVPAEAATIAGDAAPALRVEPMGAAPMPLTVPQPSLTAHRPEIVVEVKGAVQRPDVYRLPAESRVDDLIAKAGGAAEGADLSGINRAARLVDATTLVIPSDEAHAAFVRHNLLENPPQYLVSGQGMTAIPAPQTSFNHGLSGNLPSDTGGKINLNTASQAELESLPRVGEVTAKKIIEYRNATPFQRVEDLVNIHGIGEKTLEDLRPHVTVR